jgi:hypothetical protein
MCIKIKKFEHFLNVRKSLKKIKPLLIMVTLIKIEKRYIIDFLK